MAGNRCEFPQCASRAASLAHLHSIGAGGRKSADTIGNVMAACDAHALMTDGAIPGDKGRGWYIDQLALLGLDYDNLYDRKAWNVADRLTRLIAELRGLEIVEPPT